MAFAKGTQEKGPQANRIFPTAEAFEEAAAGYFDDCDARDELYSEAGLCLWLTKHNEKRRNVPLSRLHKWFNGDDSKDLQESVQMACLRIQHQIETDPRYSNGAMVSYRIFLEKQPYFGGKTDKQDVNHDAKVEIVMKGYDKEFSK